MGKTTCFVNFAVYTWVNLQGLTLFSLGFVSVNNAVTKLPYLRLSATFLKNFDNYLIIIWRISNSFHKYAVQTVLQKPGQGCAEGLQTFEKRYLRSFLTI